MKRIYLILSIIFYTSVVSLGQFQSQKDFEIGLAYKEVKQYANAIYYFEKAWSSRKSYYYAREIAETYFKLRNFDQAYYWQKKVIRKIKSEKEKLLFFEILIANNKYENAKTYLDRFQSDSEKLWYKNIMQQVDSALLWKKTPFGEIQNLKEINTAYSEISPTFYETGIVFSSNRESTIIKKKDGKSGFAYFDLYIAYGYREELDKPRYFSGVLNSSGHEAGICFNTDFQDIYFTRTESTQGKNINKSNENRMKIYKSQKENGVWNKPIKFLMNDSLNSFGQPFLSADEELFFFSSNLPGGYGGADLYVAKRIDSLNWTKPVNLGPEVNTSANEMNPYFGEDEILYFSSNGHFSMGGYDLYSSSLSEGKWLEPKNLKYPANSSGDDFSIHWLDLECAYISSNRKGGKGAEDIYYFKIKEVE